MKLLVMIFLSAFALPALADADARFEGCKKKLIQAQKLKVLYDLDWKPPREPKVVVGPTFMTIAIDAKQGFAENVNCLLMAGEDGKYINFDLLHWQTGNAVGRYYMGRLKIN